MSQLVLYDTPEWQHAVKCLLARWSARAPATATAARRPLDPVGARQLLDDFQKAFGPWKAHGHFANPWQAMNLSHNEVRNTRVLAWLLDPRGDHGQEARFLEALFDELQLPVWKTRAGSGDYRVTTEERQVDGAGSRLDIVIEATDFVVFLEAKIYAPQSPGQLDRYRQQLACKARLGTRPALLLFLTPGGWLPELDQPAGAQPPVVALTWKQLARAIAKVWSQLPTSAPLRHLLHPLCQHWNSF